MRMPRLLIRAFDAYGRNQMIRRVNAKPPGPLAHAAGHWINPVFLLFTIALARFRWPEPWDIFRLLATFAGFFWFGWLTEQHRLKLCVTCAEKTPLNPQAAVDRLRLTFRLLHQMRGLARAVIMAGVVLTLLYAGIVAHLPLLLGWLLFAVGAALFLWFSFGSYRHNELSPWCPYCRRGKGDGDVETVPTPDPVGSALR